MSVRIEDVTFFKRASGIQNLAQVRYLTMAHEGSGATGPQAHWIATIEYAYGKPSSDTKERLFNPLGFKVVSMTREPEVLSESGSARAATTEGGTP